MITVKICGLTNLEDARVAWRSGADLLGFVFVRSSPRHVTSAQAADIAARLRDNGCTARLVAVTAGLTEQEITQLVAQTGLDVAQLHSGEPPALVQALAMPAIVARRVRDAVPWAELAACTAWAYLLDGYDPARLGGAGRTWDWQLAAQRPPGFDRVLERVIVAGGLTPDNVAEAARRSRAWGVDVSSGVELAPGRKDHVAVARFIEQAKSITGEDEQ